MYNFRVVDQPTVHLLNWYLIIYEYAKQTIFSNETIQYTMVQVYIKYKQYTPAREDESSSDGAGPGETCEALAEGEPVQNDFMLAYYECTSVIL